MKIKRNEITLSIFVIVMILAFKIDCIIEGEVAASKDNPNAIEVVILKITHTHVASKVYFFYTRKNLGTGEKVNIKVDSTSSSLFDDTAEPGILYHYDIYISHDRESKKQQLITPNSVEGLRPVKP